MTSFVSKFMLKKVAIVPAVVLFVGVSAFLALAPRKITTTLASNSQVQNCENAPDEATLNFYPELLQNSITSCNDHPLITVANTNGGSLGYTANANVGDELYIEVYLHNGARVNNDGKDRTAYNVNGEVIVSGGHVSFNGQGSNTNRVGNGINVTLPSGAHLETVDGSGNFYDYQGNHIGSANAAGEVFNVNFGNMEACFEHSKFFVFKVKVVGQPETPQVSHSFDVSKNDVCAGTSRITWSTNGYTDYKVTVSVDGGSESIMAGSDSGSATPDWINPGHIYTFRLYGNNQVLETRDLNTQDVTCGTTPEPKSDHLNVTRNTCSNVANIEWGTQGYDNVKVTVKDSEENIEKDMFGATGGNQNVDWISSGYFYTFNLYGDGNILNTKYVDTRGENCGGNPVTPPSGSLNVSLAGNIKADCTYNGLVHWESQNVTQDVSVWVRAGNESPVKMFGAENGDQTIDWLVPGNSYYFVLYHGSTALKDQTLTVPSNSCTQPVNPTPKTPSGWITVTPSGRVGAQCLNNAIVSWSSTDFTETQVHVTNPDHPTNINLDGLFSTAKDSNGQEAPWIAPGKTYTFKLINIVNGQRNVVKTASITGAQLNCGVTPTPTPTPTVIPTPTPSFSATVTKQATASYKAYCPNGTFSEATVNSWATATEGSNVSQADAQAKAEKKAYDTAYDAALKEARVRAEASLVCPIPTPIPTVTPTPTPVPTIITTGNCNGSSASCNTNTNTNTGTTSGSNSPNQNNNSNINGNNNTVTQTNNNCVNNSCNTTGGSTIHYITYGGSTVTQNDYRQLSITKDVRNVTNGSFSSYQNSVSANPNDIVEFQIVVKNVGNQVVNNVRVSDFLPQGLSWVSGTFLNQSEMYVGSLYTNDTRTYTFQARVNSGFSQSIQNIAKVSGDSVGQIQDDAWVFVNQGSIQGGNVSLSYSKKAFNDTKNQDAQSVTASREDYITYTLTVRNNGNVSAENFVITDDLSQVLAYADMVENGGGTLNGNVINFPGISIPAGASVSKSFKVRVKFALASNLQYVMTNTYGNTVTVKINNPQVLGSFTAPTTGADTVGISFAVLLTAAFAVFKKRELVLSVSKLIFS